MNITNVLTIILVAVLVAIFLLQFKSLREFLLWAVAQAEIALGSKTGDLKLAYAYNLAIKRFPIIAKLIPYTVFKSMVKKALARLEYIMSNSKESRDIINGTDINALDDDLEEEEE